MNVSDCYSATRLGVAKINSELGATVYSDAHKKILKRVESGLFSQSGSHIV